MRDWPPTGLPWYAPETLHGGECFERMEWTQTQNDASGSPDSFEAAFLARWAMADADADYQREGPFWNGRVPEVWQ